MLSDVCKNYEMLAIKLNGYFVKVCAMFRSYIKNLGITLKDVSCFCQRYQQLHYNGLML